ncbi:uncharacterized protein LOC129266023 [Lytechinus pictus]|uniref:uncharacterized protein LOC129266023 n=1 Tax=Lytechinus pictus TaxID=7653 RepID=UPI0030B9F42D
MEFYQEFRTHSVEEYFKRLYLTFRDEFSMRSPGRKQFAAFSLDMAGLDSEKPIYRGHPFGGGGFLSWDFAVATSCREANGIIEHAEQRVLCHLISNLQDMVHLNDHAQHSLYLFTYLSPCNDCIIFIDQLLNGLKTTLPKLEIYLGYIEMYVDAQDRRLTSSAERSMENLKTVYVLERQFPKFHVMEIPKVNRSSSYSKLYIES